MTVKTPSEVSAALVFLVSENEKLNEGKPADSLHATGYLLPGCNLCSDIKFARWFLGEPDPLTGKPVEFPYFTEDELEHLRCLADKRAKSKLPAGSIVNNW